MLRTLIRIGSLAGLLSLAPMCGAQALPTATAKGNLQVGVGGTYANPDYGQKSIDGVSGFVDFDFSAHFGIEATVHYIAFITPLDLAENTYLIGPRAVYTKGHINLYVKALAGIGDLVIQEYADNVGRPAGTKFAYAGGGGLDLDFGRHLVIRAIDVEAQKWPSYGNGLSPTVVTVGLAYKFR